VLESYGAPPNVVDAVLAYSDTPSDPADANQSTLPLEDEPHILAWLDYQKHADREGAIAALRPHFVQLQFPISAGISQTDAYRRATRQGRFEEAEDYRPGLVLHRPDDITLGVFPTIGGRVPVLTVGDRADFVALVQAFTERNEPVAVSPAMGACLVRGLNNWHRVAAHKAEWERQRGEADEDLWAEEFRRLAQRKELYQDRLVILSTGPYSAVTSVEIGLDEAEWVSRSLVIRREHELTHYFTYRMFGWIRSHVLDELVADFVGLLHAFGRYRVDLALRFLGLDRYPQVRSDGRLAVYRGEPPLSDEAMAVIAALAVNAARNLAAIDAAGLAHPSSLEKLARLTLVLFTLSLEELASADAARLVTERFGGP
jgi:hypothetical protein